MGDSREPGPVANLSPKLTPTAIHAAMRKVADWQLERSASGFNLDWTFAALYTGFMAASRSLGDPKYENAMLEMGKRFQWQLGPRLAHADDHAVGQTYLEIYLKYRDPAMIAPLQTRFDQLMKIPDDPAQPVYWWCDALFMGPPAWVRLYAATKNTAYLDYMDRQWWITSKLLYDTKEHLYSRDAKYLDQHEANGRKVFWSRGNGWVMAGLARVLEYLPRNYPTRPKYVAQFKEMASAIAKIQGKDGLWRPGLLDAAAYPLPETSGSAFFVYGLAWGMNHGILDRKTYGPVVQKGWEGLLSHVYADGRLGSMQPVGEAPGHYEVGSSYVFGVGAFLLAGSELAPAGPLARFTVVNALDQARPEEVVEIPLRDVLSHARGAAPETLAVRETASGRVLPTQLYSSSGGSAPDLLLVLAGLAPKGSLDLAVQAGASPAASQPLVFGRFVPERQDDFAWENDKIAFRMYGPALQRTGEISSGVDVWLKRVPGLVIDDWYRKDLESAQRRDNAFSYHRDYGQGLDSYTVGPTLGCGGTAIWDGSKIIRSKNYVTWKVLASGPVRIAFELTYAPWETNGVQVSETKRIALDAGSHLNRMESTFRATGAGPLAVVAGVVMHPGANLDVAPDTSFLSVWEPPDDKTAGMIGTGIVLPPGEKAEAKQADGHALFLFGAQAGKPLGYYAGAGWSKSDITDQKTWDRYLADFAARLKSPLRVQWK